MISKNQAEKIVSVIVEELDYDLWKSLFEKECIEDPGEAKETRDWLVSKLLAELKAAK